MSTRLPRPPRPPRPSSPLATSLAAPSTSSQHPERVCDTIPVPQNLVLPRLVHALDDSLSHPPPPVSASSSRPQMGTTTYQNLSISHPMDIDTVSTQPIPDSTQPKLTPSPRKLCVRHQRMADEGTTNKMQQVYYFPSIPLYFPCSYHASSLPLAHLVILSRVSTPSHSPNAKPSTTFGLISPLRPIPVVNSSSVAYSPCAASLNFPSSPKSSAISSVSILLSSSLRR